MASIQSRLSYGLLISLIVIFTSFWAVMSDNIQKVAENYTASRIEHDVETILSAVDFDPQGNILLNQDRINPIYQQPFSGHYYSINFQQQVLRSRSLWDQSIQEHKSIPGKYIHLHQIGPDHQPLIVVSSQFKKQGHQFTIDVAEDLTPLYTSINQFKNIFALFSLLILITLLFIQVVILRKGLKPLKNIKNELTQLDQGNISQLSNNVPNELKPLTNEINHLLEISHKRLKRSRDALSDLSHAIKKPLTVLQQVIEQEDNSIETEAGKILRTQVNDILQITDRILKRARLSGNTHTGNSFDFEGDLLVLTKTISMMYPMKGISFNTIIPHALHKNIDREDMLELLGNLLDNAYKWAKTQINISIYENDSFNIIIEDDGPGSDLPSMQQLAQRGVRLDESVSGYGFGLAITSDIVHDYDGQLSFERSDNLGGFKVVIKLPLN